MYLEGTGVTTVKVYRDEAEIEVPVEIQEKLIRVYEKSIKKYRAEQNGISIRSVLLDAKLGRYFQKKGKYPAIYPIAQNFDLHSDFIAFLADLSNFKKEFLAISLSEDKKKQMKFSKCLANTYQEMNNQLIENKFNTEEISEFVHQIYSHVFERQSLVDLITKMDNRLDERKVNEELISELVMVQENQQDYLNTFNEFIEACDTFFKFAAANDPRKKGPFAKIQTAYLPYFMTTFGFGYPNLYAFVYQLNNKVKKAAPELNPFRPPN